MLLRDVDPTIIQIPRYFSDQNFTGRKVPGYESPEMAITVEAGKALKTVVEEMKKTGYNIVVYDSYRP